MRNQKPVSSNFIFMAIFKLRAATTVGARSIAEGSTPQQEEQNKDNREPSDEAMQEKQQE
jgi:hypothetical protein